jgi:hypothetical protein
VRLRLAFKLHGDEAELARQLSDAAGMPVDSIAKLAMQRYMRDVIDRAEQMMKQQAKENGSGLQPSDSDPVQST